MRARKSRIACFGRFQSARFESGAQRGGKFLEQLVLSRDSLGVVNRRRVGQRRPGRERRFLAGRHVADRERELHRLRRRGGQAPAFRGGEMLAHHIDFFDGAAAGNQRRVQLLKILAASSWDRAPARRATSRRRKSKRKSACARRSARADRESRGPLQSFPRPAPGAHPRTSSHPGRFARLHRNDQNSLGPVFRRENFCQALRHRERGFAKGDGHNSR